MASFNKHSDKRRSTNYDASIGLLSSSKEHLIQSLSYQYHMCNETLAQCEQVFRVLDVNGDGYLTPEDLSQKMLRLGIPHSNEDVVHAVKELAGDDSNEIEFDDLIPLMTYEIESNDELAELQETFKIFDRDGDGFITTTELKQVMEQLGDSVSDREIGEIIDSADLDKDGLVNFQEFMAVWKSCCS